MDTKKLIASLEQLLRIVETNQFEMPMYEPEQILFEEEIKHIVKLLKDNEIFKKESK